MRQGPAVMRVICGLGLLAFAACASVPKEAVELSYAIEQDLSEVHRSYREMVKVHFEGMREEVEKQVYAVYLPAYLFGPSDDKPGFVKTGGLGAAITNNDSESVEIWARVAVKTIDERRSTELAPLLAKESELLATIDEAFSRLTRANATITAHLNSIRKVQEVQDEALKALKLKDLRDKVNQGLIDASNEAARIKTDLDAAGGKFASGLGGPQ